MAITQIDLEAAENLLKELLGNSDSAEAYSKDPEGWLKSNGYDNVSPEAVQQCAVSYAGSGGAYATTAAGAATTGVAGVAAALDPVVYNHYYAVDNSITNNIANNGTLDFDQTIGDGNVDIEGSTLVDSDVQTQTGDGIQSGNDTNISDSNVATGDDNQQAIDNSVDNSQDNDNTYNDSFNNTDSFNTDNSVDASVNTDASVNYNDSFNIDTENVSGNTGTTTVDLDDDV